MQFARVNTFFLCLCFLLVFCVKNYGQGCSKCDVTFETNTESEIHVEEGTTTCIQQGVTVMKVFMDGGVLCNYGTINNMEWNMAHGEINNYGTILSEGADIMVNDNLVLNNFQNSLTQFETGVNVVLSSTFSINNYIGASLIFREDFNVSNGCLQIANGLEPAENNFAGINGIININRNANFDNVLLAITNYSTGTFNVNALNLNNQGNKQINNQGIFNISRGFYTGGDGGGFNTIINNYFNFYAGSLSCALENGTFTFNNNSRSDGVAVQVQINGDISLTSSSAIINNQSDFNIDNSLTISSGNFTNNKLLVVAQQLYGIGGSFNNGGKAQFGKLFSSGSFTLNETGGLLLVNNTYSNNAVLNLSKQSFVSARNLFLSGGSVHGPNLNSNESQNTALHAKLVIDINSLNNASIDGFVNIFDKSLVCGSGNQGLGFDAVGNSSSIGNNVSFAVVCSNSLATANCTWIPALTYVTANVALTSATLCPYDMNKLNAQYWLVNSNATGTYSTPVGATYTWQPGNLSGQVVTINPSVTTVYTVFANYLGCISSQTVQANVCPMVLPSISYTASPFSASAGPVSFSVNYQGPAYTGYYSIAPASNASVTINTANGLVSAYGNCFGSYTVSYIGIGSCGCEFIVSTVINLEDNSCSLSVLNSSLSLCPGDKVELKSKINFGNESTSYTSNSGMGNDNLTFTWLPSTLSSTNGLSCNSCNSPTLAFNGVETNYTVSGTRNGIDCGYSTISITLKPYCEKEEIIGCCFSNYGAAVFINESTYLNVYCNLVNELGHTFSLASNLTSSVVLNGKFNNLNGSVRVLLDWIHNGKNDLYVAQSGTTSLFGANQKIKGNSNTHFNTLWLEGNGTKSLWINAYAHSTLDLLSNELAVGNYVFAMKNPTVSVQRSTGFTSTGKEGYFSWILATALQLNNQAYLYPLGAPSSALAPFRYRPLEMANNSTSQVEEIRANFINSAPSLSADTAFLNANPGISNNVNSLAPNLVMINSTYYHKLKPSGTNTLSNMAIKFYHSPGDGQFQSVAEWKSSLSPAGDWWGSTPGASFSAIPSGNAGTSGLVYAMLNGSITFNHAPFTLAKGGFYLNTNNFGNNPGGGNGTIITLSATPAGGAPTPTGGGLNNPFGTGSNSGNTGNGGNTVFSPNPVAGEYVMSVQPINNCEIPGKIRFIVDQSGNISSSTVLYGIGGSTSFLGELSEAVYSIDTQNSGLVFSASPKDVLKNCVNSISIKTSNNSDHVLDYNSTPAESLVLNLPLPQTSASITYGTFKLYSSASTLVYTSPTLSSGTNTVTPYNQTVSGTTPLAAGVYSFELPVIAATSPPLTEIIKGQLIIK